MKDFLLPDLGEGLTEAELVRWLVAAGESVVVDQPIAEVETAKAVVEVPSPYAGVVATLHGAEGDVLEVGKPLVTVDVGTGDSGAKAPASGASAAPAGNLTGDAYREEEKAGSGNVLIGYGTSGEKSSGRRRPRKSPAVDAKPLQTSGAVLVISPIVRKIAKDSGINLHKVVGTGAGGLILRKDVLAASEGSSFDSAPIQASGPVQGRTSAPSASAELTGELDSRSGLPLLSRTPLSGIRKSIANQMSRSRTEIPEATVWVDVDATALLELRAEMKSAGKPTPSILAFVARFTVAVLQRFPELNSRVEGDSIVAPAGINLGIAAQTERGLVVPSIRNAQELSARQLDAQIRSLAETAREGKSSVTDLTSGTFTLNNYGVFGVDGSAAIINYPESGILGLGRIIDRPWVVNGELAVRKVTELTLTFDHRVCDGGQAGGFLRFVADAIENPLELLAEL